jgi:hypothetical protein
VRILNVRGVFVKIAKLQRGFVKFPLYFIFLNQQNRLISGSRKTIANLNFCGSFRLSSFFKT